MTKAFIYIILFSHLHLLILKFAILLIICTFVPYNHLNNSIFNENKRFTKHSKYLR